MTIDGIGVAGIRLPRRADPSLFSKEIPMHAETIDAAVTNLISETMQDGGWTASLTGRLVPTNGFMVGGITDSLVFGTDILNAEHEDVVRNMIIRWINERFNQATDPNTYIGGWVDQEEGYVYIDLSDWHKYMGSALKAAVDRKELAIWDLGQKEEIRV